MNRRDFVGMGALTLAGMATGLSAQTPYPRLTKETWVLPVTQDMIDEYIAEHPVAGFFVGQAAVEATAKKILQAHPPVHQYWRLGDNCIHGFSADPYTGKRLDFREAGNGIIQGYILSAEESEHERQNRGNHPVLESRPVYLSDPAASLSETELLGVLADTLLAIDKLQAPYRYLKQNSNTVYVTNAARLGLCPPANCFAEVEAAKPKSLVGGDVAFPVFPIEHSPYQSMAKSKTPTEIRKIYTRDHMAMFPNASADLRSIGPRNSRDRPAELAV